MFIKYLDYSSSERFSYTIEVCSFYYYFLVKSIKLSKSKQYKKRLQIVINNLLVKYVKKIEKHLLEILLNKIYFYNQLKFVVYF